jgi:methionyl-tRNA synthetase
LPAIRLGVGEYKLPDFIPTRGYFLLEGQKFSKSRSWYVSLRDFLSVFPADYLRYYLAAITPYNQLDVNFDWNDFQKRINNELLGNIGNFIHRTLTFAWTNYEGKIPKPGIHDKSDEEFEDKIRKIADDVAEEINKNELSRGLRKIVEFSAFCNKYFQRKQPWTDKEKAKTCIYLSVNAIRTLAILLEPFTPFSTEKIWQQLNQNGSIHQQNWNMASKLLVKSGHLINRPSTLFKKIQDEEIEKEKQKLLKVAK